MPSRITPSFDLDAAGKHQGYLTVPHSHDGSAWGSIQIPITVIRGGNGPCLLFTAGSHGDEYEGILALLKLAHAMAAEYVGGTLIILPTMNHPAVLAGRRCSPVDGANMNRVFPGSRTGSPTEMIAHFVIEELVARADVVIDLHAGGRTLDFVPSTVLHELEDRSLMTTTLAAAQAFGAPLTVVLNELDMEGMLDLAVEGMGKPFISTELGGGGTTTPERVGIAERGVLALCRHFGLIEGAVEPIPDSRIMQTPPDGFVVARAAGLLEPLVQLGEEVSAGQPLARLHFFEDHDHPPQPVEAPCDGLLYARHSPGLVRRGDCLAVLATDR